MSFQNKKILVIAPHPDDDIIGMGGAIVKLVSKNKIISCYFLHGRGIRKKEAIKACEFLNTGAIFLNLSKNVQNRKDVLNVRENIKKIESIFNTYEPDIICMPYEKDAHPTHRSAAKITKKALKNSKIKNAEIWFYEVWTPIEKPNFIVFYGKKELQKKLFGIRLHSSQCKRTRFDTAAKGLSLYRGALGYEILKNFKHSYKRVKDKYGDAFLRVHYENKKFKKIQP